MHDSFKNKNIRYCASILAIISSLIICIYIAHYQVSFNGLFMLFMIMMFCLVAQVYAHTGHCNVFFGIAGNIFIAIAFSLFFKLVTFHSSCFLTESKINCSITLSEFFFTADVVNYSDVFVLSVLLFCVQLFAQFAGKTSELSGLMEEIRDMKEQISHLDSYSKEIKESAKDLSKYTDSIKKYTEKVDLSKYAAIAAEAFKHKSIMWESRYETFNKEQIKKEQIKKEQIKKINSVCADGIEASINSTSKWIMSGNNISDAIAQSCWWRMMETYHQEEEFDVANYEVATNVRNYIYMIFGAIQSILDSTDNTNSEIVILQSTTFSPKDFYNYPNGIKGRRVYHDAEFFSIYRRSLSYLLLNPKIKPMRILVMDGNEDNGNELNKQDIRAITDTPNKTIIDSARLGVCNISLPNDIDRKSDLYGLHQAYAAILNKDIVISHFARSGNSNCRYYQQPMFFNAYVPESAYKDDKKCTFDISYYDFKEAAKRAAKYMGYDDNNIKEVDGMLRSGTLAEDFEEKIKNKTKFTGDELNSIHIFLEDEKEKALQRLIDKLRSSLPNDDFTDGKIDEIKQLSDEIIGSLQDEGARNASSGKICSLISATQKLDSLTLPNTPIDLGGKSEHSWSSFGTPLGRAEDYLFHFLNYLDFCRRGKKACNSFVPVWDKFTEDFIGKIKLNDAQIRESIRVAPLMYGKKDQKPDTCEELNPAKPNEKVDPLSLSFMKESGIEPEFLMLGIRNKERGGIKNVDWKILLTTKISEPFHTCRIQLDFVGPEPNSDAKINKYKQWIEYVWQENEQTSIDFVKKINAEINDIWNRG